MDSQIIEMGSISSRGQIAIPSSIRKELGLEEGNKIVFIVKNNSIIMKKITTTSFEELTKPLVESISKTDLKEEKITEIINKVRKIKK